MAIKETINKTSGYTPKITKPEIRITDELPPLHLIYGKTSYSIVCTSLQVKGRDPRKELRKLSATVYYNSSLVDMDETAKAQILEYLQPVISTSEDFDWYEEKEPGYLQMVQQFGEEAAGNLLHLLTQIQGENLRWFKKDLAKRVLWEPVAYILSNDVLYDLPFELRLESWGIKDALSYSGLNSEEFIPAAYYAGYLKGSRETSKPVPQLLTQQNEVLTLLNNNIFL